MDTKHSSGKWAYDASTFPILIYNQNKQIIAILKNKDAHTSSSTSPYACSSMKQIYNAEYIVRACNSHEKLLAALEQCHDAILAMQTNHCALLKTPPYEDVRLYALATLAEAKGE